MLAKRNALVSQYLPLVYSLTRKFSHHSPYLRHEDLVQEGFFGLIYAAEEFDPSRGTQFITYASRAIWSKMLITVQRGEYLIAVPPYIKCTTEEAREDRQRCAERARQPMLSLNRRYDDDRGDLYTEVADKRVEDDCDRFDALNEALGRLRPRYREALTLRSEGLTLAEVGERLQVSKERARQLIQKAMIVVRREMGVKS